MDEVKITRHKHGSSGEYRAHIPGSEHVGRLTWVERHGSRAAEHTIVPREIGGRGVAGKLVEAMVADARKHGFKVLPVCSYVAAAFERHPDWADLKA